jgi:hypothetical protein
MSPKHDFIHLGRRNSGRLVLIGASEVMAFVALASAQTPEQQWIRQLGTSGVDGTAGAAADGAGGVYVCGWTQGALGGPFQGGWGDAWLARYDDKGTEIWTTQFGTTGDDYGHAAAPDGAGGVYVTGGTEGSLGGPNAGGYDVFLARYAHTGNQLWTRQLGTDSADGANAAAPDGAGGVYVAGDTDGSLGGPNAGGQDAWIERYDADGIQLWTIQFGTPEKDVLTGATTDGTGGVFVSGRTAGNLDGQNAGDYDAFLARYDGDGNQVWILQFGTSLTDDAIACAPDKTGGVYVTGKTGGSLGGPNEGGFDIYVAHFNNAGEQIWIDQFGTPTGAEDPGGAALDGAGGVYLVGDTSGNLGGPNAGGRDIWLARYDADGRQTWIDQFGTSSGDSGYTAAPDGAGGLHIGGATSGNLGGPPAGLNDAWFARYSVACGADCDGNGALNILDFVCYQGLFEDGEPDADCDGNGVLNILDFICFQGAFKDGCP